eukprot:GHVS01098168.1.p1 GENE.GHVS01098168.1~~GHVS01098168.1.p1  ORF type:complete len:904 (+),score=171.12 GHVS01098168.1:173-2884(+)
MHHSLSVVPTPPPCLLHLASVASSTTHTSPLPSYMLPSTSNRFSSRRLNPSGRGRSLISKKIPSSSSSQHSLQPPGVLPHHPLTPLSFQPASEYRQSTQSSNHHYIQSNDYRQSNDYSQSNDYRQSNASQHSNEYHQRHCTPHASKTKTACGGRTSVRERRRSTTTSASSGVSEHPPCHQTTAFAISTSSRVPPPPPAYPRNTAAAHQVPPSSCSPPSFYAGSSPPPRSPILSPCPSRRSPESFTSARSPPPHPSYVPHFPVVRNRGCCASSSSPFIQQALFSSPCCSVSSTSAAKVVQLGPTYDLPLPDFAVMPSSRPRAAEGGPKTKQPTLLPEFAKTPFSSHPTTVFRPTTAAPLSLEDLNNTQVPESADTKHPNGVVVKTKDGLPTAASALSNELFPVDQSTGFTCLSPMLGFGDDEFSPLTAHIGEACCPSSPPSCPTTPNFEKLKERAVLTRSTTSPGGDASSIVSHYSIDSLKCQQTDTTTPLPEPSTTSSCTVSSALSCCSQRFASQQQQVGIPTRGMPPPPQHHQVELRTPAGGGVDTSDVGGLAGAALSLPALHQFAGITAECPRDSDCLRAKFQQTELLGNMGAAVSLDLRATGQKQQDSVVAAAPPASQQQRRRRRNRRRTAISSGGRVWRILPRSKHGENSTTPPHCSSALSVWWDNKYNGLSQVGVERSKTPVAAAAADDNSSVSKPADIMPCLQQQQQQRQLLQTHREQLSDWEVMGPLGNCHTLKDLLMMQEHLLRLTTPVDVARWLLSCFLGPAALQTLPTSPSASSHAKECGLCALRTTTTPLVLHNTTTRAEKRGGRKADRSREILKEACLAFMENNKDDDDDGSADVVYEGVKRYVTVKLGRIGSSLFGVMPGARLCCSSVQRAAVVVQHTYDWLAMEVLFCV